MHIIIGVLAVLLLLAYLVVVLRKNSSESEPLLEKELLQLCLGNTDKAIRLIEHEFERKPGITRELAISNAIYRLKKGR